MKIRTVLNDFGQIRLTMEAETVSADFVGETRDVRFTLCAESDSVISREISAGRYGSLHVCGKRFTVPEEFSFVSEKRAVIGEYNVYGLSFEEYPSSATLELKTYFSDTALGIEPSVYSGALRIGEIYKKPTAFLYSENVTLGESVRIFSRMFSEGYSLSAGLYDGNTLLGSASGSDGEISVSTLVSAIRNHTDSPSFTAHAVVSASLAGSPLPETLTIPVILSVPENDCRPVASVSAQIRFVDTASEVFGVPIKNRSFYRISVTDPVFSYGASLSELKIIIDGRRYDTAVAVSGVFTEAGVHSWQVILTDSRGLSRVYSGENEVYDYAPPRLSAEIARTNASGTQSLLGTYIKARAGSSEKYMLEYGNTYYYRLGYRPAGSGESYTYVTLTEDTETLINGSLDPTYSYEVTLDCTDLASSVSSMVFVLECDRVEINVSKNKVGIGKFATAERLLDCAWDIRTAGDLYFEDANGSDTSLRSFYENAKMKMPCDLHVVTSETEINALSVRYGATHLEDGFYPIILVCKANGLSYSYGVHILLCFKDTPNNIYFIRELSLN